MTTGQLVGMLALGLIAGLAGGLLGIGGSVLMIPGMGVLLGGAQLHLHQAAAMVVNVCVAAPAVLQHQRAAAIVREVVRGTVPAAIVGAIAGVFVSNLPAFRGPGQGWLQLLFAAFTGYVVLDNVRRLRTASVRLTPPQPAAPRAGLAISVLLVGLPAGFFGGLLGIGGGLIAVPAQQMFLRMPLRNAIANSAMTIMCSAVVAAVVKNADLAKHHLALRDSFLLALALAPTAMLGGWIGGHLVHRWPLGAIRLVFIAILAYATLRLVDWGVHNTGLME